MDLQTNVTFKKKENTVGTDYRYRLLEFLGL